MFCFLNILYILIFPEIPKSSLTKHLIDFVLPSLGWLNLMISLFVYAIKEGMPHVHVIIHQINNLRECMTNALII